MKDAVGGIGGGAPPLPPNSKQDATGSAGNGTATAHHHGSRPRARGRDPNIRRAPRDRGRVVLGRRGGAPRAHRRQWRRQDHPVQRHHRRFPAHRRAGPLLRRGRDRDAAARADPHGPAPHVPVLAPVPRSHSAGQPVPGGARRGARTLRLPASPRRASVAPGHRGAAPPRPARGGGRPARGGAVARPATPARDRHGPRGRPPLRPVRRAGGRALPGGAARAGRAAHLAARPHELHHHRARSGCRVAGGRAGHRDARRPRAEARHAGRDRGRRRRAGHLHRGSAPLMRWFSHARRTRSSGPILVVEKLDVYYGRAHALQEVSLSLDHGVTAVVGRNGMGKTTLCNAITGLVAASGSVRLDGEEILGLPPNAITDRGVGYVPQGRRVWPSLTVDEHLRLASRDRSDGPWTVARVYQTFPRLAERKGNGGAELSGGEQQMLAIARALLFNPILLVMDEPTEGLAPVIVQQVAEMLKRLAADGAISVLLIEQNLGVAIEVADTVDVMVNGRIARSMPSAELAADRDLQQRLLGVKVGGDEGDADDPSPDGVAMAPPDTVTVYTVRRASDDTAAPEAPPSPQGGEGRVRGPVRGFTRWNAADPRSAPRDRLLDGRADPGAPLPSFDETAATLAERRPAGRAMEFPVAATIGRAAYVAGTFDTKGRELYFLRDCLEKLGLRTVTVDLSTSGKPSPAMIHPREVARHHPKGERAVFTGDRGTAVSEMAVAFEHFVVGRRDLGGLISAGGSGGTALATPAMRRLPIGLPKMMVSSVASGDVRPYVGPSDLCMMYSVTDVAGINRISERVLANAAHALAGMIAYARALTGDSSAKPAIGLTQFGVTTPCVQAVTRVLEERYDCLVFHATGTGGQSMEKLVDSGLLAGVIDVTTTEIADEIVGGVLSAGPGRLDAIARARVPYVGSCGALDIVNFWAMDTVPSQFRGRNLYRHNANVTLMRTTPEECARIGRFIADKLNRMEGPVRFLIPDGGVSLIDR